MNHSSRLHRARGLTLIEMLTVFSIISLMLAATLPSFTEMRRNINLRAASYELISDLTAARSQAIKINRPVQVTPVEGDWKNGWRVEVVDEATSLSTRAEVREVSFTQAPARIVFAGNGRLSQTDQPIRMSLNIDSDSAHSRCIQVELTGRVGARAKACS